MAGLMRQGVFGKLWSLSPVTVVLLAGCSTPQISFEGGSAFFSLPCRRLIKPTVAVSDFDNRSGFQGRWELGSGMAELVVNELLRSRRVSVVERSRLNQILAEFARGDDRWFRAEGEVQPGRLKNARYLIRGAVTDFTVSGDSSGWFASRNVGVKGRGQRARVTLLMHAIDIETGEIIASVKGEGAAASGWLTAAVNYRGISFGGDTFLRTPLGRATTVAVRQAVHRLLRQLPPQYWQPVVAESSPDGIIINGGRNAGIKEGDSFLVRERGREVTDPLTGEIIETIPGTVVGKVTVTRVLDTAAHARLDSGYAQRGFFLEPCR